MAYLFPVKIVHLLLLLTLICVRNILLLFWLLFEPARTIEEKQQMLHAHHIALWDAIASCEITGSSDSSIREAVPTDLTPILKTAPIRQIFCNGATSYQLYCRHQQKLTGREAVKLPSTSPANAAWSIERLTQAWSVILDALD